MEIREWKAEDLETIRRITWDTWLATYAAFIPVHDLNGYLESRYTLEALGKLMAEKDFRGLLALDAQTPVGYAKVEYKPAERRCYLSSLYVLPGAQGKGTGGRLLETAGHIARQFGVGEIWLGVMLQNTQALDWYRRIGFTFVREEPFTMGTTTVQHLIGYRTIHG